MHKIFNNSYYYISYCVLLVNLTMLEVRYFNYYYLHYFKMISSLLKIIIDYHYLYHLFYGLYYYYYFKKIIVVIINIIFKYSSFSEIRICRA